MNTGLIADRYAEALENYARELGAGEALYADAGRLISALKLVRRASEADRQQALLTEAVCALGEPMQRFVEVVVRNGRASFLDLILNDYVRRYRRSEGIAQAHLVTASAEGQQALCDRLQALLLEHGYRKVEFDLRTDDSLIGGYRLRVQDTMLDASLSTQLKALRRELTEKNHQL